MVAEVRKDTVLSVADGADAWANSREQDTCL